MGLLGAVEPREKSIITNEPLKTQWYCTYNLQQSFNILQCTRSVYVFRITLSDVKKKGKAIPLHAWAGPEGSKRLRLPDFKTVGT